MFTTRLLLCALAVGVAGLVVGAETKSKADPKVLTDDSAIRQATLKRAYEAFRQKLAVLAGRLESSAEQKDRDRAKMIRKALKEASDRGVEVKFDALIRGLATKGADKSLDILAQAARDNAELRKDLQHLIALLTGDDLAKILAKRREMAQKLLGQLKELRDKQARLQAQTEIGRKETKELKKGQEKVTGNTKELLEKLDKITEDPKQIEAVRPPVTEANREQKNSEGKLGKGDRDGAGMAQGKAVSKLDEAIKNLEEVLKQIRKEENERILADLLARCKKMLWIEQEIYDKTEKLHKELTKQDNPKANLEQAARSNKIADRQNDNIREAHAALKIVQTEGSAAAFAEVFEQVSKDMDVVYNRLNRAEIDSLTLTIETDIIDTLKDAIKALEKAIRDNNDPSTAPPGESNGKPRLVSLLQQLKMIHALQRRVNSRTALYGKRFKGEQAPPTAAAVNPAEKERFQHTQKELKDLAGRQDRIAKVTREVAKEARPMQ